MSIGLFCKYIFSFACFYFSAYFHSWNPVLPHEHVFPLSLFHIFLSNFNSIKTTLLLTPTILSAEKHPSSATNLRKKMMPRIFSGRLVPGWKLWGFLGWSWADSPLSLKAQEPAAYPTPTDIKMAQLHKWTTSCKATKLIHLQSSRTIWSWSNYTSS